MQILKNIINLIPPVQFVHPAQAVYLVAGILMLGVWLWGIASSRAPETGTRRSQSLSALLFAALASTVLSLFPGNLEYSVFRAWYWTLMDIRGERTIDDPPVVTLMVGEENPSSAERGLIRVLRTSGVKAIYASFRVDYDTSAATWWPLIDGPLADQSMVIGPHRPRYYWRQEENFRVHYVPFGKSDRSDDEGFVLAHPMIALGADQRISRPTLPLKASRWKAAIDSLCIPVNDYGRAIINYPGNTGLARAIPSLSFRPAYGWLECYTPPRAWNCDIFFFSIDSLDRIYPMVPGRRGWERGPECGRLPFLKEKIVILGHRPQYLDNDPWEEMSYVNATILSNLVGRDYLSEFGAWGCMIIAMLLGFTVVAFSQRFNPWGALLLTAMIVLLFLAGSLALFLWGHWIVTPYPMLVVVSSFLLVIFPSSLWRERWEMASDRLRLQEELRTAHDMQMGLMPVADPVIPGFDISGFSKPTEEVGGDYFDYLWMNEEKTKLGIAIADVSGKAMKAAITAVMTSGMIYREIGKNQSPKEILRNINAPMYLKTAKNTFTAMSIAVIDTKTKTLTLSNAGQTHPLLKRANETRFLRVEGIRYPLGVVESAEYSELTLPLQSGDLLVFYTDGIVESTNAQKELYGFDRFEQKIRTMTIESAKQVIDAIIADAEQFAGSQKQHDDMTAVCVRVV